MNPTRRRREEVHTSLTVAPAVGWGQTSGLAAARPPKQVTRDSTGEVPCSSAPLQGLSKMMKRKNSPQKRLQEVAAANELTKNDLSNITENEFKIIVIKLIAELEKSIEDRRESIATEMKGLRKSQEELKNAIDEAQNKMEATTARIEEADERIDELEDKITEKEEAEKKRDKKNPGV